MLNRSCFFGVFFASLMAISCSSQLAAAENVRFSRDILPILADNCFSCHGPDPSNRKADLRLDLREGALAALLPGNADDSELLRRVISEDPDVVMPPPKSHRKRLTRDQTELIRQWISQGAEWGRHWAFERPVKVTLPDLVDAVEPTAAGSASAKSQSSRNSSDGNPIDHFVGDMLQQKGLKFSPEAAPHTLLRRVSLDLTGIPLTYEQLQKLQLPEEHMPVPDDIYQTVVDQLLSSPQYGERMAMWWLDAARYADTDGFQGDASRTNWPWRDWVVQAFNSGMPFDQFTVEQFAGDLLPNATVEQKLATAFHRHHMTNGEGGRDPEESRIDYVIDRVNTMGTVWLGMTLGCCQCHSHKYDPISQQDYYSLNAFFNSIDEDGKAGKAAKPYLSYESPSVDRALSEAQTLLDRRKMQEQVALQEAKGPFEDWVATEIAALRGSQPQGSYTAWQPLKNAGLESTEGSTLMQDADGIISATGDHPNQDDYRVVSSVRIPRVTGIRLEVLPHPSHTKGSYSRGRGGHFVLTDIKVQVRQSGSSQVRDLRVSNAVADVTDDPAKHSGYGNILHVLDDDPRNGWSTRDHDGRQTRTAVFALTEPFVAEPDEELVFELRQRSTLGDANIGRFIVSITDEAGPAVNSTGPTPIEQLAVSGAQEIGDLPDPLRELLLTQFLTDHQPYQLAKSALSRAQSQFDEIQQSKKVDVMVLAEQTTPRDTHILVRGVWDKKGDSVVPDVPAAIAESPADMVRNRRGLANWIVSAENPLTARVVVNHIWQMFFGAGLVRTVEDFGVQGERPSHPQLLDWLAVDLVEHDWDLRRLIRLIVTSRTYRQSSAMNAELLAIDPENRWLARGSRFRLPSWMLRDAALAVSGLMNPALGGPPVRPYQPDGVWEEMFMGRFHYEPSDGDAQYRRTLYAFWRRAIAPTFLFDSAQRRTCEVRLSRTNTPLQALTLLNDTGYLEASRALAEKAVVAHSDSSIQDRLNFVMQRVLLRDASGRELQVLTDESARAISWYQDHPDEAVRLLASSNRNERFSDPNVLPDEQCVRRQAELASLVIASSLILNLDEALTHE